MCQFCILKGIVSYKRVAKYFLSWDTMKIRFFSVLGHASVLGTQNSMLIGLAGIVIEPVKTATLTNMCFAIVPLKDSHLSEN